MQKHYLHFQGVNLDHEEVYRCPEIGCEREIHLIHPYPEYRTVVNEGNGQPHVFCSHHPELDGKNEAELEIMEIDLFPAK